MPPAPNPLNLETEASATDFMQDVTQLLNDIHNEYLGLKKEIKSDCSISYSMQVSIFPQWGTPKGGPGTAELVYSPNITWNPSTNTSIGSGSFNVAVLQNQFWTKANTASQQARLGLITQPNDWGVNGYQYNQIMYTHTLPGSWSWLSVTVGQYTFLAYDDNLYAGNAQTNFIGLPLAQNATQTYPQGGSWCLCAGGDPRRAVRCGRRVSGRHQPHRGKFDDPRVFDRQVRLFRGGRMVAEPSRRGGLQRSRVRTAIGAAAADQLPGCVF
jgi:hypothetical protein